MAKILIVDDSEVVRIEVVNILSQAGYVVLEAEDGPEGILLAKDHPDIALILSDYNMPDMNGLTMIQTIRKTAAHKNTFCGVLTTESSSALKAKGKAIGVGVWMIKPVDAKNLLKVTGMILAKLNVS